MKIHKIYWALIASVALLATVYAVLFERKCSGSMNGLTLPVRLTEITALPDGGSVTITMQDIDGRRLSILKIGTLAVASELQEMRSVSWFGFLPVNCIAPKGSSLEQEAKQVLRAWLADKLTAQQEAALVQGDQEILKTVPPAVAGVHSIATWIDKRR
jgi:hypothetical protein